MLEFVLGKTGGGKSYRSLLEFIYHNVLSKGGDDLYFVTNLPLLVGEMNALLQERFPGRSFRFCERVRLLSHEEARQFYLHREIGVDLREPSKAEFADPSLAWLEPWAEAANRSQFRLVYIIDEAHIFFDARSWATSSAAMNVVISQHRKLRIHQIVMVTQFLKQVELRLREHAVYFHECSNWTGRTFWLFALPSMFVVSTTVKPPPYPPDRVVRYRLDPALAKCYDTSAGVGVGGGRGAEQRPSRGIPWWVAFVVLTVLMTVLIWGPEKVLAWVLHRASGDSPRPGSSSLVADAATSLAGTITPPGMVKPVVPDSPVVAAPAPLAIVEPLPVVYPVGYIVRGNRFLVLLSDGRRLSEDDVKRKDHPYRAIVFGRFIEMRDGGVVHFAPPPQREKLAPGPVRTEEVGNRPPEAKGPGPVSVGQLSVEGAPGK